MTERTILTLTAANGGRVIYAVVLDKRTGVWPRKSYEAEIIRIIKMGEDAGCTVEVEELQT